MLTGARTRCLKLPDLGSEGKSAALTPCWIQMRMATELEGCAPRAREIQMAVRGSAMRAHVASTLLPGLRENCGYSARLRLPQPKPICHFLRR